MATQLRLLENQDPEARRAGSRHEGAQNRQRKAGSRRSRKVEPRSIASRIREPLDSGTRVRGLQGIAAARQALQEANQRVAVRDAERRRAKQAGLVELAGRARVIASSPDSSIPTAPHLPDGNAAA